MDKNESRLIVFIIAESFTVGDYPSYYTVSLCDELREGKYIQKSVRKWLRERKIEFIDPTDEFIRYEKGGIKCYYKQDGHWNKEGHKLVADIIFRYLQEKT